ncbi:hypothetical protein JHK84_035712 [Glycine max]|nr:hypothetical protein JHK86_035427 [Glycine max]KAG5129315.1 hypothetical protein JHK84_035712 [Glycine max]
MDRLHNQVSMPERVTHLQIYLEKVIVGVPRKMVMNKSKVFDLEKFKQLGLQFTMLVKSYNTSSHELCLVFDLERPNVLNVPMLLRCVFPLVDVSQGFKLHDKKPRKMHDNDGSMSHCHGTQYLSNTSSYMPLDALQRRCLYNRDLNDANVEASDLKRSLPSLSFRSGRPEFTPSTMNVVSWAIASDDVMGESFASLVSTVAAEESAIGLVIFVITFRVRGTIAVDSFNRELQKVTQGHSLLHSSKNIIKT